jgi:hypothetical protein
MRRPPASFPHKILIPLTNWLPIGSPPMVIPSDIPSTRDSFGSPLTDSSRRAKLRGRGRSLHESA